MKELPTYTIPNNVYVSFFYGDTLEPDKRPLATTPNPFPDIGVASTMSEVTSISTATNFATLIAVTSTAVILDLIQSDGDSTYIFREIGGSQPTGAPLSPEAQNLAASLTPQPSYTAAGGNDSESSISPIAIVGLATGGAIGFIVALTIATLMYSRRRRSGRYRQNSVTGPENLTVAPSCKTEPKEQDSQPQELPPPSLKSSPSGSSRSGSNRNRHSKHITWKDQIFSDQSLMALSSLPPHPTSLALPSLPRNCLRIGQGAQDPDPSNYARALQLLNQSDSKISYQSFSSPTLSGDCTSIYSSIPPSPVCISSPPPLPTYLFPAPHHRLQKSPVSSSQYNSVISPSNEFNDYYATITCTSVYSILPGSGSRSLSDPFAVQEGNSSNPVRKSSIRYSKNPQNFYPTFSYPKSPAPFLPQSSSYFSQISGGRNRFSSYIVTEGLENDGDSISSVSSTSSSILDYNTCSTPRKLLSGGILRVGSSSPHYYDDSPPSGGLTSPSHQKNLQRGDLTIQTSPSKSENTSGDLDSPRTLSSSIRAASPPSLSRVVSITSVSEQVFHDVFLDADTHSPTIEEISTRHFSCSMPTRPRFVTPDALGPPYLQVIPPTPTRSTFVPKTSEGDSPTLPRDPFEPSTEVRTSEDDNFEIPPVNPLRRMHRGIESTYSPTLSMVNFYTMDNHVDSRFSSENFFTPFSSDPLSGPHRPRSSSVPPSYKDHNQDEDWGRGSPVKEYSPNSPGEIFSPLTIGPGSAGAGRRVDVSVIDGSVIRKRYSSRLSSATDSHLIADGVGEEARDKEYRGEVDLRVRKYNEY